MSAFKNNNALSQAARKCGRKGRYASQCFSKVEEIVEESNIDGAFLDRCMDNQCNSSRWIREQRLLSSRRRLIAF